MRACETNSGGASTATYTYKNLEFYQLARALAVDVYKLARRFLRDDGTRVITRQFVAAATSVRLNIAEGHGRSSKAAYRNHLSIARGSAAETEDCIDLLAAIDLIGADEARDLMARCQLIIAAISRAMLRLTPTGAANPPRVAEPPGPYSSDEETLLDTYFEQFDDDAPILSSSHAQGDAQ
jgi:four helix bundle protein